MNPLLSLALFWAGITVVALAFGLLCIKFGAYTTSQHGDHAALEV